MIRYTVHHGDCPAEVHEADYALSAALAYGHAHHLPDRAVVEVQREGWAEPRRVELALVYTARWVLTAEEREENQRRCAGAVQAELFGGEG